MTALSRKPRGRMRDTAPVPSAAFVRERDYGPDVCHVYDDMADLAALDLPHFDCIHVRDRVDERSVTYTFVFKYRPPGTRGDDVLIPPPVQIETFAWEVDVSRFDAHADALMWRQRVTMRLMNDLIGWYAERWRPWAGDLPWSS